MNATEILAIPISCPERLFKGGDLKKQYLELVKEWHPDRAATDARELHTKVTDAIGKLYRSALSIEEEMLNGGGAHTLVFGKRTERVRKLVTTPKYTLGIGADRIFEIVDSGLVVNRTFGITALERDFPLKSPSMSKVRQRLPTVTTKPFAIDGGAKICWAIERATSDTIRLIDALPLILPYGPRGLAWIVSGIYDLLCYCQVHEIVFNALSPEHVWIDPPTHRVMLLSGWFFGRKSFENVTAVPKFVRENANLQRAASSDVDLACAKAITRLLFGDRSGMKFPAGTPAELIKFCVAPSLGSAIDDYRAWEKARDAAFGARQFVSMPITFDQVYA